MFQIHNQPSVSWSRVTDANPSHQRISPGDRLRRQQRTYPFNVNVNQVCVGQLPGSVQHRPPQVNRDLGPFAPGNDVNTLKRRHGTIQPPVRKNKHEKSTRDLSTTVSRVHAGLTNISSMISSLYRPSNRRPST